MIEVYSWATPNGRKPHIMLELGVMRASRRWPTAASPCSKTRRATSCSVRFGKPGTDYLKSPATPITNRAGSTYWRSAALT